MTLHLSVLRGVGLYHCCVVLAGGPRMDRKGKSEGLELFLMLSNFLPLQPILASSGCCNELPQTWQLTVEMVPSLQRLQGRSRPGLSQLLGVPGIAAFEAM